MPCFEFLCPGQALFGFGCRAQLATLLPQRGWKKALVVTDEPLVGLGIVDKVLAVLAQAGLDFVVFSAVKPNPTLENVQAGLSMLQSEGCDCLVSVGGGSPQDCAKAIAVLAANGGNLADWLGVDKTPRPALPIVAVNTTAGTGSECTRAYVITDEAAGKKLPIKDRHALASIAVNDYELTFALPPAITAGTGMDALTHAVESYTSTKGYGLTEALAEAAVRQVLLHLGAAVETPDEESRGGMAVAQYLAGLAFGNSTCGMVHSLAHSLGAVYDLPHGLCNAIMLPFVMRFNAEDAATQKKYARLGRAVFPLDCVGKNTAGCAEVLIQGIEALSQRVGTRLPLRALGVQEEDIPLLAQKTLADASMAGNPVKANEHQARTLLRAAMGKEGNL